MAIFVLPVALLAFMQIQHVVATGCNIVSVTSPSASTLKVVWSSFPTASHYLLDLRVVNSTTIAPVVVMLQSPSTERLIQGLRPGHTYQVTLEVLSFLKILCTDSEFTMTVPATSQITYSQPTSSTSIKFQWSSVIGADRYILVVEELFGFQRHSRNFTTLSGEMDGLSPATTYNCYVLSSNSAGNGARGRIQSILTLVQPPTGVMLTVTSKSTARVSWSPVSKVLLYQVTVSDVENPSQSPVVRNTSSTFMDISGLEPCSNYTVGVSSVNIFLLPGEAVNVTHSTSPIKKVTSVLVDYSCSNGLVTVSWDTVFGANSYRAVAVDGTGASLTCTSSSTSCQITNLKCGENYQVHVSAISDDCESTSDSSHFETVPCAPAHLLTSHECFSNVIVFSWQPTNNTMYYVASSEDNTGKVTECRTPDDKCYFTNVGCGQFYKYSVYAVSAECNSDVSLPEFVRTSPCLPTNVRTAAQCDSDVLITTWDAAAGALSYTVEAQGNAEGSYNCTSSSTSCAVTGVPCGEHLSVWIFASNDNCSTSRVLGEAAQTVPCTPTNISASVQCSQDSATISWTSGYGAVLHMAEAVGSDGAAHTCSSLGSSCELRGLACGRSYTVSVIGTNLRCNSSSSQALPFSTAPCPPINVEALRDCDANHAVIVWQNHQHAHLYTATMEDESGSQLTCNSSTVNNCKVAALPCGRKYNVTVSYSDGSCVSTSAPVSMDSVPCGPQDVNATISCLTGELNLTWHVSAPAENYTAFISGGMGEALYCYSTETRCSYGSLQCSTSYSVVVFSITGNCQSFPSPEVTVHTSPCPPRDVLASPVCAPTTPVSVSWVASDGALTYVAVALSASGHSEECRSNSTSCSLSGLRCGETYRIGVSGVDEMCAGPQGDLISVHTEPCVPTSVSSVLMCSDEAAQVFWAPSSNAIDYQVTGSSDGGRVSCSSSSTSCTLTELLCGHQYNITVSATNGTCVSDGSQPITTDRIPCPPTNVVASWLCASHSALVSWVGSANVLGYNVTATGRDGHTHLCYSNSSSCEVSDIHCGQTYSITVTASSDTCEGTPSTVLSFTAGLCAPTDISVSASCEGSTVSWAPVAGADGYIATAIAADGHTFTCSSNSSNFCDFTELLCGMSYTVTVVTVDSDCESEPSSALAQLRTALCPPTNLTGQISCHTNTLTLTWSPIPDASYILLTSVMGHTSPPSEHSSADSNYTMSHLLCGQRYSFQVAVQEGACRSSSSPPFEISTAPCQPSNLTAQTDCGTNRGNFSWAESKGAAVYTVQVMGEHGHVASCSSNSTSCAVKLDCGRSYSATLVASSESCNSSSHADIQFDSAPCLPEEVLAELLTCNSSVMNVSWAAAVSSDQFTAWAISSHAHTESCNSTSNHCSIHGLECGKEYEVTVTTSSMHCSVIAGSDYRVQSAPCKPDNVTVRHNCSSKAVEVSWRLRGTTQKYTVQARSVSARNASCESMQGSCSFMQLDCGQSYTFTVIAHTNTCVSDISSPVELLTAPCPPTDVSAELNCSSGEAVVRWSAAAVSTGYRAHAIAASGHNSSCSSPGTSCRLRGLLCAQVYSVFVEAVHTGCPGPTSTAVTLTTGPCAPQRVSTQLFCASHTVVLWWEEQADADAFIGRAVQASGEGGERVCNSSSSNCSFSQLHCGHTYNFTVSALREDTDCHSAPSDTVLVHTGPCQPVNVSAKAVCQSDIVLLTWQPAYGAHAYTLRATGSLGHTQIHNSSISSLSVALLCGQNYEVTVQGLGSQCDSPPSTPLRFKTTPCVPWNVETSMQCELSTGAVTWGPSEGAESYVAVATSRVGHAHTCETNSTWCSWSGLDCGEEYMVVVRAMDRECTSLPSNSSLIHTAACVPRALSAMVECDVEAVSVSWNNSGVVNSYRVSAQSRDAVVARSTVNSSATFFELSCGQIYNVSVTPSSQHCPNTEGVSTVVQTWPCVPTGISVGTDCANNTGTVSWSISRGATAYSVTAHSRHGNLSCQTSELHCDLANLTCGTAYMVQVVAMDASCSSVPSAVVMFHSGPCPPHNVRATVDCTSNNMTVFWDSVMDTERFEVLLSAEDGTGSESCNTTENRCHFTNTPCGRTLSAQVASIRAGCRSSSRHGSIQSAPCPPQGVTGSLDCVTNSAWISWDAAGGGGETYTVYATAAAGGAAGNCSTSTNTTCELQDLDCGVLYSFTVTAHNNWCESTPSAAITLHTAPCSLSNISVVPLCRSSSILVTWEPMEAVGGRVMYTATAEGSDHTFLFCNSTGSSCSLLGTQCGLHYTVVVAASSDVCSSLRSRPSRVSMEPCPPTDVMLRTSCAEDSALVSWSPSATAHTYHVVATSADGHHHSCNTSSTNCSLSQLQCEQHYNVSVTARHDNCSSDSSGSLSVYTGPCRPTGLSVTFQCHPMSAVVRWTQTDGVEGYWVRATMDGGAEEVCSSRGSSCSILGLECGQHYNFSVRAYDGTCNSSYSPAVQAGAAPCPPDDVGVQLLQAQPQLMVFSWTPGPCKDAEYLLRLSGSLQGDDHAQFNLSSYWSAAPFFEMPLPCSSAYTATVESRNGAGTSGESMALVGVTAPCPPAAAVYSSNGSFTTVSWEAAALAQTYTVYDGDAWPTQLCHTSHLSCSLSNVLSTRLQVTASNQAGESPAADASHVNGRRRRAVSDPTETSGALSAPEIKVQEVAPGLVFIEWSSVGAASSYSLTVRKQQQPQQQPQELTVYGKSVVLTDLSRDSYYCFSVRALSPTAAGPESEPLCVQTGLQRIA